MRVIFLNAAVHEWRLIQAQQAIACVNANIFVKHVTSSSLSGLHHALCQLCMLSASYTPLCMPACKQLMHTTGLASTLPARGNCQKLCMQEMDGIRNSHIDRFLPPQRNKASNGPRELSFVFDPIVDLHLPDRDQ